MYGGRIAVFTLMGFALAEIVVKDLRVTCLDECNYNNVVNFLDWLWFCDCMCMLLIAKVTTNMHKRQNEGHILTENDTFWFFVKILVMPFVGCLVAMIEYYNISSVCRVRFWGCASHAMNLLICRIIIMFVCVGAFVCYGIWRGCKRNVYVGSEGDEEGEAVNV